MDENDHNAHELREKTSNTNQSNRVFIIAVAHVHLPPHPPLDD